MAVAAEEEACSEEVRTTAGDKPRASLSQVGSPEPTSRVALPQAQVAPPQADEGVACDRAAEGSDAQPEGETAKGLDARPEEGPAERFDAGAEASKGNPRSGLAPGMRSRCRRMWSFITMMQLALYLSCALLCSQLVLSVHDSPGQSTRIVKMVSHTPPASSMGAKVTPGGSRTVDGNGETIEVRTSRTTAKRGAFEYMRPVGSPDDENTFKSAVKRESRGIKRASMTTEYFTFTYRGSGRGERYCRKQQGRQARKDARIDDHRGSCSR